MFTINQIESTFPSVYTHFISICFSAHGVHVTDFIVKKTMLKNYNCDADIQSS